MGSLAGTLTAEPATSAEDILAEMLADVMKIEQVPVDSARRLRVSISRVRAAPSALGRSHR